MAGRQSYRLLITMLACQGLACGAAARQQKIEQLDRQMAGLRSKLVRVENHVEDLSDKITVLSEQVRGQKSAKASGAAEPAVPSDLEIVRLEPNVSLEPEPPPVAPEPIRIVSRGPHQPARIETGSPSTPQPRRHERNDTKMFQRGLEQYQAGRTRAACETMRQFVKRTPTHAKAPDAIYWLGKCQFDLGELTQALKAFQQLVKGYPRNSKVADAMLNMAVVLERTGREPAARQVFEQLLERFPNSALADLATVRLSRLGHQDSRTQ